MTGRERLLATLRGELPDRVPVSLFVQEEFLSCLYPGRPVSRVTDAVACARRFGFDVMTRDNAFAVPYYLQRSYPGWEVSRSEIRARGMYYQTVEIKTPSGALRQVQGGPDAGALVSGVHLSTLEYLLRGDRELEIFLKHVPRLDLDTLGQMREKCRRDREEIGQAGISVPWGSGGVFNQAASLRNVTDLLTDAYTRPDVYRALMGKVADLTVETDYALAMANGDAVGVGGNLANGAMVGADFFRRYILPYEKQLLAAIGSAGAFTVYHNCGSAAQLMPCYAELCPDAWETVAAPPRGDNDLASAKAALGERMTLIGNLDQVSFLKRASTEEIAREVERTVSAGKSGGRYIFACSDYLEADTPFENIETMVEAAVACGGY